MKFPKIHFLLPVLLLGLAISGCGSKSSGTAGTNGTTSSGSTTSGGDSSGASASLDEYAKTGPYKITVKKITDEYSVYCPQTLTSNHPVITWGHGINNNDTCYTGLLQHLASHGFVVVYYNIRISTADSSDIGQLFTKSGTKMIGGIDLMQQQNTTAGSFFYNKLNMNAVGAAGHSMGGGGTLSAAKDSRVKCAAPIMPAPMSPSGIKGSLFIVTGSGDTTCTTSSVKQYSFDPFTGKGVFAELQGVDHASPCGPNPPTTLLKYVTAWFKLNLNNQTSLNSTFFGSNSVIRRDASWGKVSVKE